jgi:hypothetical protein
MFDELVERRVIDFLGMKLKLDPFVESHRAHFLRVTGPRSEGQPVERLDYLLVSWQLAVIYASCRLRRDSNR